jgi:hypothetical protein
MISMKAHLDRWEARLQALVEGSASRFFAGGSLAHHLTAALLESMRAGCRPGPGGGLEAPNLYVLSAGPDLARALQADPGLLDELAMGLQSAGLEAGLTIFGRLALRLLVDDSLAPQAFGVQASFSQDDLADTQGISLAGLQNPPEASGPGRAFLIVNGFSVFALDRPVINIGRLPDNHLSLDDPRVSRLHAQLRLVRGRYVIFDLASSGGTWVNGQRIHQQPLAPGDVISLAGLPLVFGVESLSPGETQEYQPPGGEAA